MGARLSLVDRRRAEEPARLPVTYALTQFFFLNFVRRTWVKEVSGLHNIPADGGALLAMNHQSYLDFLAFGSVCPRRLHYLAAERFFRRGAWHLLMWSTDQIRVDRTAADKGGTRARVLEYVGAGRLVGIFPEGTRSPHPDRMLPAYTGVAQLAFEAGVPIVPVGIQGAYEVLNRFGRTPSWERRISIHVGEPIHPAAYGHDGSAQASVALTTEVMHRIADLSGRQYGGVHQDAEPEAQASK